jgi:nucleoside diphosphate kinase
MQNAVHGSDNQEAAEREINFFFPDRKYKHEA